MKHSLEVVLTASNAIMKMSLWLKLYGTAKKLSQSEEF